MNHFFLKRIGLKLVLLPMLALMVVPELADAQFGYNQYGDVMAGFRKTGVNAGNYELVVDLGSVTNFLKLSIGTTINITNYSPSQLTNAFIDTGNFANLQWSVFSAFPGSLNSWVTPLGSFPPATLWVTLPGTNVATQTQPPARQSTSSQQNQRSPILGVGAGAIQIAGNSGITQTPFLVQEPTGPTYALDILTALIGDKSDSTLGDFGSGGFPLAYSVENETPVPFSSAQRDDFYQLCPTGKTDPINSSTTSTYYLGYFILNPNGSMTFTRQAQSILPPVAGFSGSPTTGFAPLPVVFTDASSGSITNWLWSFGDGQSVTNISNASVNHTYAAGGSYTVTLTVSGAGGANADTQISYVVVSSTPTISTATRSGGSLVMGGTGNPAGAQYRILTSTNLTSPLASWTPVTTNAFLSDGSYSYTNSAKQNAAFFRLVSP